jgi:hypothetical protein
MTNVVSRLNAAADRGEISQKLHRDLLAEHMQLRANLSLAEEGLANATQEIERLKRYSLIVESYLDRETLKEVLKKWRKEYPEVPQGRPVSNSPDQQHEPCSAPAVNPNTAGPCPVCGTTNGHHYFGCPV